MSCETVFIKLTTTTAPDVVRFRVLPRSSPNGYIYVIQAYSLKGKWFDVRAYELSGRATATCDRLQTAFDTARDYQELIAIKRLFYWSAFLTALVLFCVFLFIK